MVNIFTKYIIYLVNIFAKSKLLTQLQAWKLLRDHDKQGIPHLRSLFTDDPQRGERMKAEAEGLFLDYSKNRIIPELKSKREPGLGHDNSKNSRADKVNGGNLYIYKNFNF